MLESQGPSAFEERRDDYNLILSAPLVEGIGLRLERKEQVILLQNRRGFAPV